MDNQRIAIPETSVMDFPPRPDPIQEVGTFIVVILVIIAVVLSIRNFIKRRSWSYVLKFTAISMIAIALSSVSVIFLYQFPISSRLFLLLLYFLNIFISASVSYLFYTLVFKSKPTKREIFLLSFFGYAVLVPLLIAITYR